MRSREEIVEAVGVRILDSNQTDIQMFILEVLLDIRELLIGVDDNVNRMDDRQRGL